MEKSIIFIFLHFYNYYFNLINILHFVYFAIKDTIFFFLLNFLVDPKVMTLFNPELEIAEGSRNTITLIGFGIPKPVSILLFGEETITLTSSSSIGNNTYKYVYQIGPLNISVCGRTLVHKLIGMFSTVNQSTTVVVLRKFYYCSN